MSWSAPLVSGSALRLSSAVVGGGFWRCAGLGLITSGSVVLPSRRRPVGEGRAKKSTPSIRSSRAESNERMYTYLPSAGSPATPSVRRNGMEVPVYVVVSTVAARVPNVALLRDTQTSMWPTSSM